MVKAQRNSQFGDSPSAVVAKQHTKASRLLFLLQLLRALQKCAHDSLSSSPMDIWTQMHLQP